MVKIITFTNSGGFNTPNYWLEIPIKDMFIKLSLPVKKMFYYSFISVKN